MTSPTTQRPAVTLLRYVRNLGRYQTREGGDFAPWRDLPYRSMEREISTGNLRAPEAVVMSMEAHYGHPLRVEYIGAVTVANAWRIE